MFRASDSETAGSMALLDFPALRPARRGDRSVARAKRRPTASKRYWIHRSQLSDAIGGHATGETPSPRPSPPCRKRGGKRTSHGLLFFPLSRHWRERAGVRVDRE